MNPSRVIATALLAASLTAASHAAIQVPLHIGTTNTIKDEQGNKLQGTDPAAGQFGHTVVLGDIVHILRTFDGTINPPATTGLPTTTNNIIIATTRIGAGTDPAAGQTGQFGLTLPEYTGETIFARVFNAPQLTDASFYANSQIYTPSSGYSVFTPTMTTVQPLDGGDDDGDGLINSWEKTLGTSPTTTDTDGDGINDYNEFLSGTDANDSASFLKMVQVLPAGGGDAIVFWASISGKTYQVQYNTGDLTNPNFEDIGSPVSATGTTSQIIHSGGLGAGGGQYRVKINP